MVPSGSEDVIWFNGAVIDSTVYSSVFTSTYPCSVGGPEVYRYSSFYSVFWLDPLHSGETYTFVP